MSTAKILLYTKTLISTLKTHAFRTKTPIATPKTTISTPEPRKFDFRVFYSLSLRLTLAVSTPVVSFRSTPYSVCII